MTTHIEMKPHVPAHTCSVLSGVFAVAFDGFLFFHDCIRDISTQICLQDRHQHHELDGALYTELDHVHKRN
jgi:hypothetical protein